ncbi:MAG: metalloregulator ArsR/SmtB family transcription factor [Patescibacteria group bacterium]
MNQKENEKILKALANGRRIAIVNLLKKRGVVSVGEIAQGIKLSFNATSKHLKVLFSADIVDKNQVGLVMFYRISASIPKTAEHIISVL